MSYHSIMTVLQSVIIVVSNEEPEAQVGREVVWTRLDFEDDFECVQIDNYGNSGPHRREGCRMRRVKRGGYCKAPLN